MDEPTLPNATILRPPGSEPARSGTHVLVEEPLEDPRWQALLDRHALARVIAPRWEELAGWTTWGLGRAVDGVVTSGLLLSARRIPGLPLSLGRVTCLMVGPGRALEEAGVLLGALDRFAERERIVEIELRLRVPTAPALGPWAHLAGLRQVIESAGYRMLGKTEQSYLVDLDRDDDALLASFEGRTRSAIRKALREGGEVTVTRDASFLTELHAASEEMRDRKNAPIPPRHLVEGLAPLMVRGHVLGFLERVNGVVSNLVAIDATGLPCYVLGARTKAHVDGKVAGSGQLVQYEIMRHLRDRGVKHYDLGGCEGPVPEETHPNFGVWRFKYRFQGTHVRFLPYFRRTRSDLARWLLELGHRVRGDHT